MSICFKNFYFVDFILTEGMLTQEIPISSAVVAFYAYMSANQRPVVVIPHHVYVFDVVRTNVGNAYNYHSSTGVFTVPQYMCLFGVFWTLSFTLHSCNKYRRLVGRSSYLFRFEQSTICTSVIVAHVNKGDDVFVKKTQV